MKKDNLKSFLKSSLADGNKLSDGALDDIMKLVTTFKGNRVTHIRWVEPFVFNIKIDGNTITFDIDWGRNAPNKEFLLKFNHDFPRMESSRLVFDGNEWTYYSVAFPNGRNGTKCFLQYDHEFPKNLCDAMGKLDSSQSYK